jgi:hypothetical protein
MSKKTICLAVSVLVVCLFMPVAGLAQPAQTTPSAPAAADAARKFVVYYFHGDFRCDNCKKIEQYSREAVEKYFADQLKSGELEFKVVNTDRPENQHFIKDYQLYASSLLIVEFKGTTQVRWKNLTEIWNNLDDQEAFHDYVKTEIQKYMESA